MSIYGKILALATHFNKLAAEVTNLNKYKKKKEWEQKKKEWDKKGMIWLFEQMDPQTVRDAFASGGLTVDDMHQARKAVGFREIDKNAPPWVFRIFDRVDEKNPQIRKARYNRFAHNVSLEIAKTEEKRKEIWAEINKETQEQEQQFKEDVKRGWMRFSEFNKWKNNYPLLFGQFHSFKDFLKELKKSTLEQLKNRNEYHALKAIAEHGVVKGSPIDQLPDGTILYTTDRNGGFGEWIQKIGKSEWGKGSNWRVHWSDGRDTSANDEFVKKALEISYELYPTLITVPISYIEKIKNKPPTENEIQYLIQYTIDHDPDRFLMGHAAYHSSNYIPDDDEDVIKFPE